MINYRWCGLNEIKALFRENNINLDAVSLFKLIDKKGTSLDLEETNDGKLLVVRIKI